MKLSIVRRFNSEPLGAFAIRNWMSTLDYRVRL